MIIKLKKSVKRINVNKFWLVVICIMALCFIVILAGVLSPNSAYGYKTLLVDSHTNIYKAGHDFEYAGLKLNISISSSQYIEGQSDCTGLIYGGIFSSAAKSVINANQNWWPREDCEKQNAENAAKSASKRYVTVTYSATNRTGILINVPVGWFIVTGDDGRTLIISNSSAVIAPSTTIHKEQKELLEVTDNLQSLIVTMPGHAPQIVSLNYK